MWRHYASKAVEWAMGGVAVACGIGFLASWAANPELSKMQALLEFWPFFAVAVGVLAVGAVAWFAVHDDDG